MTQAFSFSALLEAAGGVEDSVLPADEYTVTVLEAESVVAQSSGNPMLKVKFSVVGGPHDGTWIWNNFVLAINSDKGASALKPFFRQMATFGIDAERFKTLNGLDDVAPLLIGQTVTVKTGTREYGGKTYVDVKSVSAANVAPAGVPRLPQMGAAPTPTPQVPAPAAPPVPQVAAAPATPPVAAPTTAAAPPPPPF